MKIGILAGALVLSLVILSGCGTTAKVTTDDGSVTINTTGSNSWCQAGNNWNYQGSDGASGEWKIKELVQGGKYDGLCHVVFNSEGVAMDYYFDQTGKKGYVESVINGQTFSQEWNS